MHRVNKLRAHLAPAPCAGEGEGAAPRIRSGLATSSVAPAAGRKPVDINAPGPIRASVRANILDYYDQIKDVTSNTEGYNVADYLPGPQGDLGPNPGNRYRHKSEILRECAQVRIGLVGSEEKDLRRKVFVGGVCRVCVCVA